MKSPAAACIQLRGHNMLEDDREGSMQGGRERNLILLVECQSEKLGLSKSPTRPGPAEVGRNLNGAKPE